jgi:hypothetical protein
MNYPIICHTRKPRALRFHRARTDPGDARRLDRRGVFGLAAVNYLSTRMVEYWALPWVATRRRLDSYSRPRSGVEIKGADMLAWLLWRLERMERIHAVAGALMSEFGAEAYAEARRRERQANRDGRSRDWSRVALVIARRTSRLGLFDDPAPTVSDEPRTFRIQFVCGTLDHGPTNLMEKQIQVLDTPAAIIAAANIKWPPQTIGVRILSHEGHEVFARQKALRDRRDRTIS